MSTEVDYRPGFAQPARLTGENPFDVDPTTDLLHEIPADQPGWVEHMFFHVWNPTASAGVWVHVGRFESDPTLWWAQVFGRFPDGSSIADRSYGRAPDNKGPATGNLRIRCEEPHQRWTITFDGAGERTNIDAMSTGVVGGGIVEPMRFEVELTAAAPVIDFSKAMGAAQGHMASLHHQQALTATGSLTAGGETYSLAGISHRDHSAGARHLSAFGGTTWPTITFPESGRALHALLLWSPQGQVNMAMTALWENGVLEIGNDFRMSGLVDPAANPRALELRLMRLDGSELTLTGQVEHALTITMGEPNHNLNGAALGELAKVLNDPLIVTQTATRWQTPDGEVGYGNLERDYRLSMLPRPEHPLPPSSAFVRLDRSQLDREPPPTL
jgi:hypothetical protein